LPRPALRPSARATGGVDDARVGERRAWFGGAFVATAIYERARLPIGARVAGPAIIEQMDTTTVVPPGHAALVDPSGNLRIARR
jgi:N-methylhydantoinase A